MVDKGALNMDDLRIVWKSTEVATGPVTVPKNMPEAVVNVLIEGFNWINKYNEKCMNRLVAGKIRGWVPATHRDYETMVDAVRNSQAETCEAATGGGECKSMCIVANPDPDDPDPVLCYDGDGTATTRTGWL